MQENKKLRADLKIIADIIEDNSQILDLGCGKGELLDYLVKHKNIVARGIELSQTGTAECVSKGLAVIQGDIETDLIHYPDECFDYVISANVLQATYNPKEVLKEIVRIGKKTIITIPNFGHYANRLQFILKGKMPVNKNLPFSWYETPNIHFCTIKDFDALCKELGIKIRKRILLNAKDAKITGLRDKLLGNLIAAKAVYYLE